MHHSYLTKKKIILVIFFFLLLFEIYSEIFNKQKNNDIISKKKYDYTNEIISLIKKNYLDDELIIFDKNNNLSLNASDKKYLLNRHFFPTPRIELGKKLIYHNLSKCAIDVSDGLLADLLHICQSSKLGAKIYQNQIPFSASAKKILKKNPIIFPDLISGGDDYELIFTSDKKNYGKIRLYYRHNI